MPVPVRLKPREARRSTCRNIVATYGPGYGLLGWDENWTMLTAKQARTLQRARWKTNMFGFHYGQSGTGKSRLAMKVLEMPPNLPPGKYDIRMLDVKLPPYPQFDTDIMMKILALYQPPTKEK